jgi:outer membrane protein assembly factor BamB
VNSSNAVVAGTDFPQFLGPARNGIQAGPKLATNWQSSPPLELWRRSVGAGWSGFAVSGALAITQEQHGSEERVVAYELGTGQIRWSHADQARYSTTLAGEGPRATPTITGQRVVTMGATGLLNCLDPTTGQRLWSVNIVQANESKVNEWGMSGSPLIWRDLVVVSAGGRKDRSLVAYRLGNGEFAWGGGTDSAAYSSPIVAQLGGSEHIIMFNANSVVSHDPATGTVRWKYPWPGTHPHVAAPVTCPGDRVLVSSGYGHGSEMLQVTNTGGTFSAAQLWKSRGLKAKFNNPIYLDGHIYGLDDGIMVCLNADTGQQQWKDGRYGHGQMLLVGDLLLVTAESGEIVLLRPSPKERVELARFSALRSKTWNPPAVAGEFLLIRNDQEAACYRLPLRKG